MNRLGLSLVTLALILLLAGCRSGVSRDEQLVLPLFDTLPRSEPSEELKNVCSTCFAGEHLINLEEALRLADLTNPTIGLAEEVVRANRAEQIAARSLLYPTLNLGTTLAVHRGNLLSAGGLIEDVNRQSLYAGAGADVRGSGTVNVPGVYVVGQVTDAVFAPRIASQRVRSSQFDAVAARHNILLDVSTTYLDLVGAEARLLAFLQSASEFAEVATLTANFAAQGQGLASDAGRAQTELLLLRSAAQRAEEEVIASATELARLLNLDPAVRLQPEPGSSPLIQLIDPQIPLPALIQTALVQRPEITARNIDVAVSETRLRQERFRPLLPTLVIGCSDGDYGGGSNKVAYSFSHFGGRSDVDVLAVWTLQNLGVGNRAVQNRVRAEIGQAEAVRLSIVDQVGREVAEAFAQIKSSRLQLEIAKKRVETAQQAYRQDLTRAKNLQGHVIEVLNSLNLLSSARQDLVIAMIGYSRAQFRLHVAIGGGL